MSVDYSLFLRDQPDLAVFEEEYELEMDGDDYVFAGFRLWIHEYAPSDEDPLAGHPWQGEIKWVLAANGRHSDDSYDDFQSLMSAVGERYRGGLWCDHGDGDIEWFGWNAEELAKQAAAWSPAELVHWLAEAREAQTTGAREQVAQIALGRLASFPRLQDRQAVILELWQDHEEYSGDLVTVIGDALLELDPGGNEEIFDAQQELHEERARDTTDAAPLPTTRADVHALIARAATDPLAERMLGRAVDEYSGSAFVRGEVGEWLLASARAGDAKPPWIYSIGAWPQLADAPERKDPVQRAAFAKRGPFARDIAKEWDASDAYEAKCNDLLERRRRAGEMFAGIPDDVRAMARTDRKAAVAEYAKRYGLTLDKAKQVVDANA